MSGMKPANPIERPTFWPEPEPPAEADSVYCFRCRQPITDTVQWASPVTGELGPGPTAMPMHVACQVAA